MVRPAEPTGLGTSVCQAHQCVRGYVSTSGTSVRWYVSTSGTSIRQGARASLAGATGTLGACGSLCGRTNGAHLGQICVRSAIIFCGMLCKFLHPLGLDLFVCKWGGHHLSYRVILRDGIDHRRC